MMRKDSRTGALVVAIGLALSMLRRWPGSYEQPELQPA